MKQYDAQLDSVDGWPAAAAAAAAAGTSTASSTGDRDCTIRDSSSPVDAARDLDQDTGARRQSVVEPVQDHFFGTSSLVVLMQSALELKKKVTGNDGGATSTLVSPSGQKIEVTDANPVSVSFFLSFSVVVITTLNNICSLERFAPSTAATVHLPRT